MNPKINKIVVKHSRNPARNRKQAAAFVVAGALLLAGLTASLLQRNAATPGLHTAGPLDSAPEPATGGNASNATVFGSPGSANRLRAGNDSTGDDFSGIKSTLDPTLVPTVPRSSANSESEKETTAPLPLVLQPVDLNLLKLTPEQQGVIERLQQYFVDMAGGPGQNPNDLQYLDRWQTAQQVSNDQLKAQLGLQFFMRYESAAAQTQFAKANRKPKSQ